MANDNGTIIGIFVFLFILLLGGVAAYFVYKFYFEQQGGLVLGFGDPKQYLRIDSTQAKIVSDKSQATRVQRRDTGRTVQGRSLFNIVASNGDFLYSRFVGTLNGRGYYTIARGGQSTDENEWYISFSGMPTQDSEIIYSATGLSSRGRGLVPITGQQINSQAGQGTVSNDTMYLIIGNYNGLFADLLFFQ